MTLPDGTPVSSGEGGGVRIGGAGAYQPGFTHHMFLPVDELPEGELPAPDAPDAPAVLVDAVAPEPAAPAPPAAAAPEAAQPPGVEPAPAGDPQMAS
ncbi:hypothetical protein [Mycobacterium kiyosense]|uniref:hypothetical protein n=1 Tax=Mycobacterium kiyosense TaxID=2871094 RepID=UPI0035A226B2